MVFVVWSVALSVVLKGSVSGGLGGAVALAVVLKERVWSVRGGAFHGAEGAPSGGVWGGTSHPPTRCSPWCRRSECVVYGADGVRSPWC